MMTHNAKQILLSAVQRHNGQWGWYQFERAFPPGSIEGNEDARVTTLLAELEQDGLIHQLPVEPQPRYALTAKGHKEVSGGS